MAVEQNREDRLRIFFTEDGNLPKKEDADSLKPKVKIPDVIDDAIIDTEPSKKEEKKVTPKSEKETSKNDVEKGKDFSAVLNDLSEVSEKENPTFEDVEKALGAKADSSSSDEKTFGDTFGIGAEEIIDLIDAARQWAYLSMYDKKINLDELEEELDDLIQKKDKNPSEDARMKRLNAFLSPARKNRQKFSDKIPYSGGVRKRLENVARITLAKLVKSGRVPEWLVLVILMGFQDGRLIINMNADNKSLPKI